MTDALVTETRDGDVIDALVGLEPGEPLFGAREVRPEALAHAQGSFEALFSPDDPGTVTAVERYAVAAFVALLHGEGPVADFYLEGLKSASGGNPGLAAAITSEAARGRVEGPYGSYREPELAAESVPGEEFLVGELEEIYLVGPRLACGLNHAHFLVFHPRDAAPWRLEKLAKAGWSSTDIVTLSQLVAFLSYQIRVVAGLSALKKAGIR